MNSELQNKLFNIDVQPPSQVWDKIAASLDENLPATVSQKLFQFQETPPEAVWLNISQQLDAVLPEHGRIIPMQRSLKRSAALIAAAAVIIIAGVTAILFVNRETVPQQPAQNVAPVTLPNHDSSKPATNPDHSNVVVNANNLPKPRKAQMIATTSKPVRKQKATMQTDAPMVTSYLPRSAARKEFAVPTFSSDKYMIYSDDDGNAVRLPKKIFAAYVCPDESDACKQRLQQLRERFAESAVTADFTGLLEILKSLQENQ